MFTEHGKIKNINGLTVIVQEELKEKDWKLIVWVEYGWLAWASGNIDICGHWWAAGQPASFGFFTKWVFAPKDMHFRR